MVNRRGSAIIEYIDNPKGVNLPWHVAYKLIVGSRSLWVSRYGKIIQYHFLSNSFRDNGRSFCLQTAKVIVLIRNISQYQSVFHLLYALCLVNQQGSLCYFFHRKSGKGIVPCEVVSYSPIVYRKFKCGCNLAYRTRTISGLNQGQPHKRIGTVQIGVGDIDRLIGNRKIIGWVFLVGGTPYPAKAVTDIVVVDNNGF